MDTSKIAIIIPAYNAERTLKATVESVLAETLRELEVWIVDDGSTDDTGRIADELAARDRRVKVIHQENQGSFCARMNALKHITTPYFGFVDADDTVEKTMHERMVAFAEENDLDVVQCDLYGQGTGETPQITEGRETVIREVIRPWLFEGKGAAIVWDKIYRRECVDVNSEMMFKYSIFEDLILNLLFFRKVKRFGRMHEGFYHYQVNDGSITRKFSERNIEAFKETLRLRKELGRDYGVDPQEKVFDDWGHRNAKNLMRQAALAAAPSNRARAENVRMILELEGMRDSFKLIRCYPLGFVIAIRIAYAIYKAEKDLRSYAKGL